MDYGDIRYDFSEVHAAGTGLQREAAEIANALQEFENLFQNFIMESFDEGEGSGAFAILQTQWSQKSVALNEDLQAIGAKVVSGGEHMEATDKAMAKMLANGSSM
ncbi:WXG100 family type VII secretion target [Nocardia asteroides]|uniref:WXG100 family type VII secretion target n=1 Tax=Nocardia asteroides TaxID=1824 RepID=UPI0037C846E6